MEEKVTKISFRGVNTQVAKGVAVLLLVWHHLRFGQLCANPVPSGFGVLVAFYGKVCVAIFLVLSGYGLWMSYNKKRPSLWDFYTKKITNLMTPYWICFIIFGALGAMFFGRTMNYLYGGKAIDCFINFLGLNMYFKTGSMNDAWWFISLILLFYVLFPFGFKLLEKFPIVFTLLTFATVLWRSTFFVVDWIFPFCIGMVIAKNDLFAKTKSMNNKWPRVAVLVLLLAGIMYLRYLMTIYTYYTYLKTDGFIAVLVIQILFELYEVLGPLNKVLEFLGNHSYNIYLCHSFFMVYFFYNFVYGIPEVFSYTFVVGASILASFGINWINGFLTKMFTKKEKPTDKTA